MRELAAWSSRSIAPILVQQSICWAIFRSSSTMGKSGDLTRIFSDLGSLLFHLVLIVEIDQFGYLYLWRELSFHQLEPFLLQLQYSYKVLYVNGGELLLVVWSNILLRNIHLLPLSPSNLMVACSGLRLLWLLITEVIKPCHSHLFTFLKVLLRVWPDLSPWPCWDHFSDLLPVSIMLLYS